MAEEAAVPPIVDPGAVFGDTITVSTAQVIAFQDGMNARIQRQRESIDRLLKRIEDLQAIEIANADEIARLSRAIVEEQEMYQEQKALLDRARAERDELQATFDNLAVWMRGRGAEHTREGEPTVAADGLSQTDISTDWSRHDDLTPDPEDVVRAAIPDPLPVGEARPAKHLAGE